MSKTKVKLTILYCSQQSNTYFFLVDKPIEADEIRIKLECGFRDRKDLLVRTDTTTILIRSESYIGLKIQVV
jgi:hypothetical protein